MDALTSPQRELLTTLAARIVPESNALGPADHDEMMALIDAALSDRPVSVRRQFATFLNVLRWAPVLRYGRPLAALAPAQQDDVLRFFQDCPVTLLRCGFWGVRTLVLMGYYARPSAGRAIGYSPTSDGNAVIHARTRS